LFNFLPYWLVSYLSINRLAHPAAAKPQAGLCSASVSLFCNDFCHTNYLNINRTDLCQIFRIRKSKTMAVDYQSEISFSIA